MIKVREYTETYREIVRDVILPIQNREFGIEVTYEDQDDLQNIKDFYQKRNGNFWLAQCGEEVVGTIALKDINNHEVALRKMFVKAPFRGHQYKTGQILLDTAIQFAQSKNIKFIYLGTTAKFLAAHRFYEKNHFVLIEKYELPPTFLIMDVDTRFYKLTLRE